MTDFAKKVKRAIVEIQYRHETEFGEPIVLAEVLKKVHLSVTPYYKLIKTGNVARTITYKKFEELIILS